MALNIHPLAPQAAQNYATLAAQYHGKTIPPGAQSYKAPAVNAMGKGTQPGIPQYGNPQFGNGGEINKPPTAPVPKPVVPNPVTPGIPNYRGPGAIAGGDLRGGTYKPPTRPGDVLGGPVQQPGHPGNWGVNPTGDGNPQTQWNTGNPQFGNGGEINRPPVPVGGSGTGGTGTGGTPRTGPASGLGGPQPPPAGHGDGLDNDPQLSRTWKNFPQSWRDDMSGWYPGYAKLYTQRVMAGDIAGAEQVKQRAYAIRQQYTSAKAAFDARGGNVANPDYLKAIQADITKLEQRLQNARANGKDVTGIMAKLKARRQQLRQGQRSGHGGSGGGSSGSGSSSTDPVGDRAGIYDNSLSYGSTLYL